MKVMDDFIVLSCKSCGGRLEITSDLDRFACAYCGTEQIVNRRGGVVSLELVSEKLDGMKVGIDRTAAELAIIRLTNELQELHIQATTLFETISELKDTLTNASSQKCELEETVLPRERERVLAPNRLAGVGGALILIGIILSGILSNTSMIGPINSRDLIGIPVTLIVLGVGSILVGLLILVSLREKKYNSISPNPRIAI